MKKIPQNIFLLAFLGIGNVALAQKSNAEERKPQENVVVEGKKNAEVEKVKLSKPYDAKADAAKDIEKLIAKTKINKKNIILQAGGNWCIWCLRFNHLIQTTPELKNLIDKNFEYYHLNYSPENKNEVVFKKYDNPGEKYGYPVFILLDSNGKQIHIQASDVFEEGKGYSVEKVKEFLQTWSPNA